MPTFRDLKEQRFGSLLVLYKAQTQRVGGRSRPMWTCICDCGRTKAIPAEYLVRGSTKSCGCKVVTNGIPRLTNHQRLYNSWKINSSVKPKNPNLTLEQFTELVSDNCYYCNVEPLQIYVPSMNEVLYYNGIDRIDNSIGYEYHNCRPCCGDCNRMKLQMSEDQFFDKIKKIYERHITPKAFTNQTT